MLFLITDEKTWASKQHWLGCAIYIWCWVEEKKESVTEKGEKCQLNKMLMLISPWHF